MKIADMISTDGSVYKRMVLDIAITRIQYGSKHCKEAGENLGFLSSVTGFDFNQLSKDVDNAETLAFNICAGIASHPYL
jgi:hypothetical protein